MAPMTAVASAVVPTYYRSTQVDGLNIAYREAGDPGSPKLVLLHGFPASSHQYRDLIPALATRFHVIAPDYPGFGNSDMPDPATFAYTFDRISEIIEAFLNALADPRCPEEFSLLLDTTRSQSPMKGAKIRCSAGMSGCAASLINDAAKGASGGHVVMQRSP